MTRRGAWALLDCVCRTYGALETKVASASLRDSEFLERFTQHFVLG